MNVTNQTIIDYLLGGMSEAEAADLEQRYFTDSRLFDQIVEVENDLVDRYARGQLLVAERQRFESHYLAHPERHERAKFAAALVARADSFNRDVTNPSPLKKSWWAKFIKSMQTPRLAAAFSLAILVLIAGVVWFAIQSKRLHQQLSRSEAERAQHEQNQRDLEQELASSRARAEQLSSELDRAKSQPPSASPTPASAPLFATLVLTISGVRGVGTGPPAKLVIPAGTESARIQLNLRDNDYSSYSVVIQTADGKQIFRKDGLRSARKNGATLVTTLPTKILTTGDYILTLKGTTVSGDIEDVHQSLFHVDKK